MEVIEISEYGTPNVLALAQRPIPVPQAGEVLIRVTAAGINRPDVLQRQGRYPAPPGASDIPGLEVAGEIIAGDFSHPDNHWQFRKQDPVCALLQGGGYAQFAVAPIAQCLPIPKGWSAIEAASLPETCFTVWSNVFDRARLGENEEGKKETLLVQGGSSGIGVTAIQMARAFGHPVFATAGTDEKCRACEKLGAQRAIHYKKEDFVDVIKTLTAGRGVDVILDMVGGDYVPRELKALANDGRLVLIALLGGATAHINLGEILLRRLTVTGSTLRARSIGFKAKIAGQLRQKVWPLLESGQIRPVIYQVFPMTEAARAHALMEAGSHIGKLVLLMR